MINPSQFLSQVMMDSNVMKNPRARKVIEAYKNHDHDALVEIGNNIFNENGTTLEEASRKFMYRNRN